MINLVQRNEFLKSIFPTGIGNSVMIGQIGVSLGNRCSVNIHTQQCPAKEIAKWGKWGENFNVIVIELLGCEVKSVSIKNFAKMIFGPTSFEKVDDLIIIDYFNNDCQVHLEIGDMIFQKCSTYII